MNIKESIDIVIPSFRLNEELLLNIFHLKQPEDAIINYYLIADNPKIRIPRLIQCLVDEGKINLIINDVNLGYSGTRNKGIDAGNSKWVLLLDDDIVPEQNLLFEYVNAIRDTPDAIGFIGPTLFPKALTHIEKALEVQGITAHAKEATIKAELSWAPTTNVLLNKDKLGSLRFTEGLFSGEDILFLFSNAVKNNALYISVPNAIVYHPWWGGAKSTFQKMFYYGRGNTQITSIAPVKYFAYYDFLNSIESVFCLLILLLIFMFLPLPIAFVSILTGSILIIDLLICNLKCKKYLGFFSMVIAWNLYLVKISWELGNFYEHIISGKIWNIGKRIDLGFKKKHPSPFRLNRWKIIKIVFILIISIIYFIIN